MKKNFLRQLLLTCSVVLAIVACQKDINPGGGAGPDTPVDLGSRVNASVTGFVTDENDQPVMNATVKFGIQTVSTDQYGYFQLSNISVPKNAAMVSVSHSGYFPGIRTFIAKEGKGAFVRIKLIPKGNNGTISAANGGSITLTNGLKVALPAGGVVNAGSGAAYTGTVNVAAHWIDPTAADRDRIMPGDLRAIDTDNNFKQLVTYGMAAVELTSATGEKLQVAPGKKATLTMPLPSAIAGSAPASIPLWYFDEAVGLWKEEGSATKTGNTYVGEVSHFSFWNCDVPNNYVQLDMTIKTADNAPVRYAYVKVTELASGQWATGYTDNDGYVNGAVPANSNLRIDVFYGYSCGTPLHTQTATTTGTNLSLGTIIVTNNTNYAALTGTVTNCSNTPVTNGAIFINTGSTYWRYNLNNDGSFSIPYYLCNGSSLAASIIAEDYATSQQSAIINHTIVTGTNALGTIQACGTTSSQFLNISINGTPDAFSFPADSLTYYHMIQSQGSSVSAMRSMGNGTVERVNIYFMHTGGIVVGNNYPVQEFYASQIGTNASTITINNATSGITITEYGAVGEFIAGNYVVNATGPAPANTPYAITGSFRMRRNN